MTDGNESSSPSLSLQVVAGRAPPASAVGVYLKLFFFSPSLHPSTHPFPLHYDAALLPPLWFTWLCPVSTFWHKSQLTRPRPSLGTLNDPSLLEITPPPPPGSYEHYTMLPTTGEIKREREQPRVLVYIQMAKEHNKQLRLGIWNWAIEFIRIEISICDEKVFFEVPQELQRNKCEAVEVTKSPESFYERLFWKAFSLEVPKWILLFWDLEFVKEMLSFKIYNILL